MDLDVLKSVIAVAETGSFSKAGTRLCVSQSAVSKRIKLLEDTFGLQLLDRSGPVLLLTAAGKVVEKNARSMLEICSRCTMELAALRGEVKLDFRCTPSYGIAYMPAVTRLFTEQNPGLLNLTISIGNLGEVVDAIQNDVCQLAVVEHCELNPVCPTIRQEALNEDSLVFVGAPSLRISADNTRLDNLLSQTLYMRSAGCCSQRVLEHKLIGVGCALASFANLLVCDDLNMIVRSLLSGAGISYLARGVVVDQISSGLLQEYDLPEFSQTIARSLLYGSGFTETKESLDLVEVIRSLAGSVLPVAPGMVSSRILHPQL